MLDVMISVSKKLRVLRTLSERSNKEIARNMNLSEGAVSAHMNGTREPGYGTLNDYCLLFNITLTDFFCESVPYVNNEVDVSAFNRIPSIKRYIENASEDEIREIDLLIAGYIARDSDYGKRKDLNRKCENSNS